MSRICNRPIFHIKMSGLNFVFQGDLKHPSASFVSLLTAYIVKAESRNIKLSSRVASIVSLVGFPLLSLVFEVTLIPVQTSTLLDPVETHCLSRERVGARHGRAEISSCVSYSRCAMLVLMDVLARPRTC